MTQHSTAIARVEDPSGLERQEPQAIATVVDMTPEVFKRRIENEQAMRTILKDYVKSNMVENHHYSRKLGTVDLPKPMLLQEGVRNICSLFKLYFGEPEITETYLDGDHYRVRTHIKLYNAEGRQIASGDAVCSTRETKYAYRKGDRLCPECGGGAIIKGKSQYGGGWLCYANKGGCGAKFGDDDERITSQQLVRIDNPDKADVENTVLKIAIKRAKVAAVCDVAMVSEIFAPEDGPEPPVTRTRPSADQPQSSPKTSTAGAAQRSNAPQNGVVQTAVDLAYKLQKQFGVDAETLAMQFLPEGVAKFSDLTEEQAAEAVPGLVDLMNAKLAGE